VLDKPDFFTYTKKLLNRISAGRTAVMLHLWQHPSG